MTDISSVFRDLIQSEISQIHSAMPGIITEVDPNETDVSVQPTVQVPRSGGSQTLPIIHNVPFVCPQTSDTGMRWRPKVGNTVLLIISELDIDAWMDGDGGVVPTASGQRFSLSDAIAIPGLLPISKQVPISENVELEMRTPKTQITINTDGSVTIGGSEAKKLINEAFKDTYEDHVHNYTDTVQAVATPKATSTPFKAPEIPETPSTIPSVITPDQITSRTSAE